MLNTYGLRMSGLRTVAGETKSLTGSYSPEYLQLNYDRSTGEVWTDFFFSVGHNNWTKYQDENVLNCGNLCSHYTMQELANIIYFAVQAADAAGRRSVIKNPFAF